MKTLFNTVCSFYKISVSLQDSFLGRGYLFFKLILCFMYWKSLGKLFRKKIFKLDFMFLGKSFNFYTDSRVDLAAIDEIFLQKEYEFDYVNMGELGNVKVILDLMQHTIYKAVIWQNENLPLGSKIGSFNAGIQGYFTSHKLVNLDGLVNKNASEYMMKQDMWNYIKNVENLDYISDFPQYFDYRYKLFFGIPVEQVLNNLEIIHSETSNGNTLNTYKIKK